MIEQIDESLGLIRTASLGEDIGKLIDEQDQPLIGTFPKAGLCTIMQDTGLTDIFTQILS